ASTKRDQTALVATTWDKGKVRVVAHRVWQPSAKKHLDYQATIVATLREWHRNYLVQAVWFDPHQMQAVAQQLAAEGIPMQEYSQSAGNLTAMGSNLFELIQAGNLRVYPAPELRSAVLRAVAREINGANWKITRSSRSARIDLVVALAMS